MSERDFLSATPRMLLAAVAEGERRDREENMRAGTLAAVMANVMGGGKQGGGSYSWEDFFGTSEEPDPKVLKAKARATFAALKERRLKAG